MLNVTTTRLKKDSYVRPKQTTTDKLTSDEVESKLEDYTSVTDISKVPIGTHIRYFVNKDGKPLFRLGGFLYKIDGLPEYVILNNGTKSWSVQVVGTKFFRKQTLKEIKAEYQKQIDEKDLEIKKINDQNEKLIALAKDYKKQIDKFKKNTAH
jgi:hypothetical protein